MEATAIGVRQLTVLGEFKPFGLIAEALDGRSPDGVDNDVKYDYFLFDPEVTRERDGDHEFSAVPAPPSDGGDHEIFIRGNRLIWSSGSRLHKRYSCPNPVLMACWCRMEAMPEPFLCVLQGDTLSIYSASGEGVSIPLTYAVASIWPLPFGLLLQKANDGTRPICVPFTTSSSLRNARDLSRRSREYESHHYASNSLNSYEHISKDDTRSMSSHLILKHPLEEPQTTFFEERGKLSTMKDFDERTIWTSEAIPLLASYHEGKMKHSIWIIEMANSYSDTVTGSKAELATSELFSKQYCFRRIWQGKCSQLPATKVFLASDDDGVPIICFLVQEQTILLFVRLEIDEGSDGVLFDVKPQRSWSIPAIDAAPVIVTRPRISVGHLPFSDVVVLTSDSNLLLYSGNQCLCRYVLPTGLRESTISPDVNTLDIDSKSCKLRITGIADSVQGRINIAVHNGKIFRCALRRNPSSSLANDCVTALSEGLHPSFFNQFCIRFWGHSDLEYPCNADSCVDSEWDSFVNVIMDTCKPYGPGRQKYSQTSSDTSWKYLLNSKFHIEYRKNTSISHLSVARTSISEHSDKSISFMAEEPRQDNSFHAQFLTETLDALHALYESLKLDNLRRSDLGHLGTLLCKVAACLGEKSYVDHYIRDFPDISAEIQSSFSSTKSRSPPCIFRWLERCLKHGCQFANKNDLPPLLFKERSSVVSWAQKIVSFYSLLLGAERFGKKLSSGVYYRIAKGSTNTADELVVLSMVAEEFGLQQLDLLPAGVSFPLRHALDKCRESPPRDWPAAAYVLVGREDLALACLGSSKIRDQEYQTVKNLISISTPYMLHLQAVTVPSSLSDIGKLDSVRVEDSDSINNTLEDGMEQIFNSSTQLRYGRDLRLNEVRRLLCSARPVAIQTSINPSATDQDHQQHQLWNLAQRTTALPLGRGAFTLATTYTLLTESLVIPKLNLAGRLPAQQNATVNLDPNLRNITELRSWPEFHNGVAAGLGLAPFQGKISRTWIHYNKPEEPNFTHAGVLLALGLHGHLRVLTITDVYRYLSQEHDITTVGILLGMAASHRGTMHPSISKMLYLHIPSRHPSSFPELELPTLLQSAALMAVGLLYEGSAHPLTMKILMGEIGRRSSGDNVLEREGYAVAAGSALGLVALGRGNDALGFMESFLDRLFQYIGGKESYGEKHIKLGQTTDEQNRGVGQLMDGTQINVDVTSPGATIALALTFLKTESEEMAARLSIPSTLFDLQYVRPDFIMLRIIARSLIMWSRVQPSHEWVEAQIPEIIKFELSRMNDENTDNDDVDVDSIVQAYVNIVAGACISVGLRYAGTRNAEAQELLQNYAVYFLNELKPVCGTSCKSFPKGLLQYVDRGTIEICLHLVVLSLSVVMAGSGHLKTFRLLRYLRNRSSVEGHISYGIQMAVSLAIGFLFIGGGLQTFSTGNSAIAALLFTLYPRLPTGPNDNRCHLQAFRHFYVIAAESRWVQTVDVDTGLPVYAPLEVTISETAHYAETSFYEVTPCILPERAVLKTVRVCGPRYWPQVIELMPEEKPWWKPGECNDPFNGGLLYIKRKVGACSYIDDPIGCQSLLSRAMHKVSETSQGCYLESTTSKVDTLVGTFSADPSLIAFARLCCDSSWNSRSDADFQEFCSQVLFECVSKDRPALLQVYISLYTNIGSIWEQIQHGHVAFHDSLFLLSLKLAVAYNDAVLNGKLTSKGQGIVQTTFVDSLRKRLEEILESSQKLRADFLNYLETGRWPVSGDKMGALLLSWYLQWYEVPAPHVVKSALAKIKSKVCDFSAVPLLHLLLPGTHDKAIAEIDRLKSALTV